MTGTRSAANELHLQTYRYGTARKAGEGLRIGATRRPPRGVRKKDYVTGDYFDIWFPLVAPSHALLATTKDIRDAAGFKRFAGRYRNEVLKDTEKRQAVMLLAELARRLPIAIGCYCEDEAHCHRSILYTMIVQAARSEL